MNLDDLVQNPAAASSVQPVIPTPPPQMQTPQPTAYVQPQFQQQVIPPNPFDAPPQTSAQNINVHVDGAKENIVIQGLGEKPKRVN
jgi:hypothetical protein